MWPFRHILGVDRDTDPSCNLSIFKVLRLLARCLLNLVYVTGAGLPPMIMEFKMNTKTFVIASLSTLALLALPGVASASPFNSDRGVVSTIEWRLDNQFRRIQNGRVDGSLTHREFRTLMRANRRLNRTLNRSLDDGFLSLFEEDRLFAMLGL